jgi:ankyrin repeat protein
MKHLLLTTIAAVMLVTTAFAGPIHNAARDGYIEDVKQHLAAGTDVNAKNLLGEPPLNYAVWKGHKEIVELLIDKGADVNAKIEKTGDEVGLTSTEIFLVLTPLDWAIEDNHTEIADLLRKHGGKTGEELKAEGK